jgi:hypothetical protein
MGGELHIAQALGGEIRVSGSHHYTVLWIQIQLFTIMRIWIRIKFFNFKRVRVQVSKTMRIRILIRNPLGKIPYKRKAGRRK